MKKRRGFSVEDDRTNRKSEATNDITTGKIIKQKVAHSGRHKNNPEIIYDNI